MADIKLSALPTLTQSEDGDFLVINDASTGSTKKITRLNLIGHLATQIRDSADGGIVIPNGDLTIANELIAGGDISTAGKVKFGMLTDFVSGSYATGIVDSEGGMALVDSAVPTTLAARAYSPADTTKWTGTDPTTIKEALDRIAAALGPIA